MTCIGDNAAEMDGWIEGPIGMAQIYSERGQLIVDPTKDSVIIEVTTEENGYASITIDKEHIRDVMAVMEMVLEEEE